MSLERALAAIAATPRQMIDDLAAMIACDTSFPPGSGYASFAELMTTLLEPLDFAFERVRVPESLWRTRQGDAEGARVNLIARPVGAVPDPARTCNLYFHTDTVPPGDGWTRPPLALTQESGRLYGRGSADMKGSIAAALMAVRSARLHGVELRFDPVFLLCTDEEGGLYPGIRYLAEQGRVEGHLLSYNGGAAPRIWGGCFGSIDLAIRVEGRGAHSGDPGDGVNAFEAALPIVNALHALKPVVEARVSAMPAPPHFKGEPLRSRLTLAAGHGGSKGSSLPARFDLLVNRRYAPEERFDDVMAELESAIAVGQRRSNAVNVSHEIIGHLAPVSDPGGPHWPRWQAALAHGFGYAADDFRRWGASTSSDMGWVQQAGIQEILLGGLSRPDNATHAPDEFTTLDDLIALAQATLLYLADDFQPSVPPAQ
ncbi:M20 family metallopeptidase [Modicisalibacter radicis]|uniref:M20 family metallopeptidase n=1 Tax=Halomonas sp. EAR18 TaxID=2518972 RepID=UPI001B34D81D|nr:M20 family metallopeptidase [Halomonas sp. EAR18]